MTMTKADLVKKVADGTGLTNIEVGAVVNGVLEALSDELVDGGRIELRGFGTFKVEKRAERDAMNPHTGQRIRVPSKRVPVFRASEKLKSRVDPEA